jgi:Protein of unknown function (DUF4446)
VPRIAPARASLGVTHVRKDRDAAFRISGASVMNDALLTFLTNLGNALTSPVFAMSLVAAIAVAVVYHWAIARRTFARARSSDQQQRIRAAASPEDFAALRGRVDALEATAGRSLQRVGFVRFNAFPDVGSELSYALAVVDRQGNGFLLSSIYSREEVRTYAKAVRNFSADKDLSDEELRAIELARAQ